MNLVVVGLGPYCKRIYMKFLNKYNIVPKLIVDLDINTDNINKYIKENKLNNTSSFFIESSEKDNKSLSKKVQTKLKKYIESNKITHAIISTEPKAHLAFAKFFLKNNINILMDKPITAPKNVVNNINQAKLIKHEYNQLAEEYRKRRILNNNLNFSVQCQRRFHSGYIYIKNILIETIKKYNIPISYIDIYHCDGMWNMPDEFIYRENHPYKDGYGKMLHSGYHFIDLLVWLLEANQYVVGKDIDRCSIYSEAYMPSDFAYAFNNDDYNKILKTDKFKNILTTKNIYNNYGEIDIHSIISFKSKEHLITNCSLNLMQSGFSRRSWVELPENTYKGNGRVRHERLNIQLGPLMNIQVHSYQAYEVKEREKHGSDNVGDLEHFDIYIFRNSDLIGGEPFEKVKLSSIDYLNEKEDVIRYTEKAREMCFIDFINDKLNESNLIYHNQSIEITEKIYESLIYGSKKVEFNYNLRKLES